MKLMTSIAEKVSLARNRAGDQDGRHLLLAVSRHFHQLVSARELERRGLYRSSSVGDNEEEEDEEDGHRRKIADDAPKLSTSYLFMGFVLQSPSRVFRAMKMKIYKV